ncbi:MAG: hypothetical protein QF515_15415 [Pseudomonadales bacterium]|nr:hypothetical protein [Pseudomonadales bacterium]
MQLILERGEGVVTRRVANVGKRCHHPVCALPLVVGVAIGRDAAVSVPPPQQRAGLV